MDVRDPAELVRELRRRSGLSQADLAAQAGMAQSAISDFERGRKAPSLQTLQRLAGAVDLDVAVTYIPARRATGLTMTDVRRRRAEILGVCARHGASRPRVFGSVASGTATSESDLDLVVDLEPGRTLFDVAALRDDLTEILRCDVDVLTAGALHGRLAGLDRTTVPV